jgi:hypothetical protein
MGITQRRKERGRRRFRKATHRKKHRGGLNTPQTKDDGYISIKPDTEEDYELRESSTKPHIITLRKSSKEPKQESIKASISDDTMKNLQKIFHFLYLSVESKKHHKIYKDILDRQFHSKLIKPSFYNSSIEGMNGIQEKFKDFGDGVSKRNQYTEFNRPGIQTINSLKDWIIVFELLFGFESLYKTYISSNQCNPVVEDDVEIKTYCDNLKEPTKNEYPNKNWCSPKNKKKHWYNIFKKHSTNKTHKKK